MEVIVIEKYIISEAFENLVKKNQINEATKKLKKRIPSDLIEEISQIIIRDFEGKIKIDYSKLSDEDMDRYKEYWPEKLANPYMSCNVYSLKPTQTVDSKGKRKETSFQIHTWYQVQDPDLPYDKTTYNQVIKQIISDVENLLNNENIQFDEVTTSTINDRTYLDIIQYSDADPYYQNLVNQLESLYITVPTWYRIKIENPHDSYKRTLCFGGIDKDGFIYINAVSQLGMMGSPQVTFIDADEAKEFILRNGYQYARVSKSKATERLVRLKSEDIGATYATERFVKNHLGGRYPLPLYDATPVEANWSDETDDDFEDYQ